VEDRGGKVGKQTGRTETKGDDYSERTGKGEAKTRRRRPRDNTLQRFSQSSAVAGGRHTETGSADDNWRPKGFTGDSKTRSGTSHFRDDVLDDGCQAGRFGEGKSDERPIPGGRDTEGQVCVGENDKSEREAIYSTRMGTTGICRSLCRLSKIQTERGIHKNYKEETPDGDDEAQRNPEKAPNIVLIPARDGYRTGTGGSTHRVDPTGVGTCVGRNDEKVPELGLVGPGHGKGDNGTHATGVATLRYKNLCITGKEKRLKRLYWFLKKKGTLLVGRTVVWEAKKGGEVRYDGDEDWPIHAPKVCPIPDNTIRAAYDSGVKTLAYLWDPELYTRLDIKIEFPATPMKQKQMETMVEAGIWEMTNEEPNGYIYLVSEFGKKRRRVTHDTLIQNICCKQAVNPGFKELSVLRDYLSQALWLVGADMKASYYQFELHRAVRSFFVFWVKTEEGVKYRLRACRLPMGFIRAVEMVQGFLVWATKPLSWMGLTDVYVDNVAFFMVHRCEGAREVMLLWLNQLGITIGDSSEGFVLIHRGMVFDVEGKRVRLKDEFVEKTSLRQIAYDRSGAWGDLRGLMGSVTYGIQCMGLPIGLLFHVWKQVARLSTVNPKRIVRLWKSADRELSRAVTLVKQNKWRKVCDFRDGSVVIFTDAALAAGATTLAGIIMWQGKRREWDWSFNTEADIATCEIWALLETIKRFAGVLKGRQVRWYSDNVVALCAMARGGSKNFQVNRIACDVWMWAHQFNTRLEVIYVPSALNPADPLTRGRYLSPENEQMLSMVMPDGVGVEDITTHTEDMWNGSRVRVLKVLLKESI
jgi:hypothetical protein